MTERRRTKADLEAELDKVRLEVLVVRDELETERRRLRAHLAVSSHQSDALGYLLEAFRLVVSLDLDRYPFPPPTLND